MSSTPRVEIWWTLQKMGCYWTEEYSNTTSWLAVWLSGNVLASMVGVVSGSLYMRTRSLSHLAWSWVGGRLAPFYITSNEPGEVSEWFFHDDSTINIGIYIIIRRSWYSVFQVLDTTGRRCVKLLLMKASDRGRNFKF